jgi:hypothetical protein
MCRGIPSSSEPPTGATPRALSISMGVFLFILSLAALLVAVFVLWCRRRGQPHWLRECYARRQQPFPVETLPAFTYARDSDGSGGGPECSVCLGAVHEGEMVRRLPVCMHMYHVECIDRWLAVHRTCPLCRSELDDPSCKVDTDHSSVTAEGEPPDQLPV